MSSLFDNLSEELFQILKGSGKTLTLYGEDGNKVYDPKKARRVFAVPGNIMISVMEAGSDSEVKLYLSQSTDVTEISGLIDILRQITTRFNVMFNVRKYGRELEPKDFAYQASMTEAAMWGTTRTSYQKFGPTKLIIRHLAPVREGVIGARGRNILGMFVETQQGERFKFPQNHLSGGRAFAQHINQGGQPHDTLGTQIATLAQESLQLTGVNRYINYSRKNLDESAQEIRTPIRTRIKEIRRSLVGLAGPRGYHRVVESGLPLSKLNLSESVDGLEGEISKLYDILQINSNHALAESLMPVALLTMGEYMNNNNKGFHSAISLDENAANSLVEALQDEYGHDSNSWSRNGTVLTFNESNVFEDAVGYLDLVEQAYQLSDGEEIVDEGFYDDDPTGGLNPQATNGALGEYESTFDATNFLQTQGFEEFLDATIPQEHKTDPVEASYFVKDLTADIAEFGEDHGLRVDNHEVQQTAKTIWEKKLKPLLVQNGWHFTDSVNEFAQAEEKPEHHGFAAGDYVSTDLGAGQIVSIEGDIAAVEFMNGAAKEMHIDDMDKVGSLGESAEEQELAEWFNSFDPQVVLDEDSVDEARVDELSKEKVGDYFNRAASDRGRAERKAAKTGDTAQLDRRERGLRRAFDRIHNVEEAYGQKSDSFTAYINLNGEEDIEVEVEYYFDDDQPIIDSIVTTSDPQIQVDYDSLSTQDRDYIYNSAHEDASDRDAQERDYRDQARNDDRMMDRMYGESEEVIGGDQGEDLIDDVKVDEDAELNAVLKNAFFRK